MNLVFKAAPLNFHDPMTISLILDVSVIQYLLRNNVILKDRDNFHVPPLLYAVTYFILFHTLFNVADILMQYIENLTIIMDLNFQREPNLTLVHFISYILQFKYNISYLIIFYHTNSLFTNYSYIFYGLRR